MDIIGKFLALLLLILVSSVLYALPVMWLWNWLMPEIFGLIRITIWQAMGLCFFTGLLFKNGSSSKD